MTTTYSYACKDCEGMEACPGMVVASIRPEPPTVEVYFGSGETLELHSHSGEFRLADPSGAGCDGRIRSQHAERGRLNTTFDQPVPEILAILVPLIAWYHAPTFVQQPRSQALRGATPEPGPRSQAG